jgi:hypothetical protein
VTKLETLSVLDFKGDTKRFDTCDEVWAHPATMAAEFGPMLEFAHHPAAGNIMTTDWTCHDQTYQPVVEVYSGWGNSLEYETDYDPLQMPIEEATVHYALEMHDLKLGFVGGTDIHDTRPGAVCAVDSSEAGTHIYGGGLTVVVLPDGADFARSSIYGELVARRSLVTTGPQLPVLVHWTTPDGVEHAIGEEVRVRDSANETTTLTVEYPASWNQYVTGVQAVGYSSRTDLTPASGAWSHSFTNDTLPKWLYVEVAIDGAEYYGPSACVDGPVDELGVTLDDREFVWSSPVWFERTNDLDGDGYAYDADDCNDDDAAINPGAREIWMNRIDENCDGRIRRRTTAP